MSSPNPTAPQPSAALVAASPFLKTILADLKVAVSTTFTGDPLQLPVRAEAAFGIFLNELILIEPSLAVAESGVVGQDINAKIDGIISKLP